MRFVVVNAPGQVAAHQGAAAVAAVNLHPAVMQFQEAVDQRQPKPCACARAGAPFVILDLAYPPERLAALAGVCRPKLQLLAGESAGLADCGPAIAINLDAALASDVANDVSLPEVSPDAAAVPIRSRSARSRDVPCDAC